MIYTTKVGEVCIKTRSPPASLPFKGQVTKQTTMKWSVTGITLFTRQIHIQWVIVGKTSHAVDQIMRSTVDSIIQHEIRRWEHKIQITRHRASRRKRPQKTWRVGHLAPVLSVNSSVTLPDQKFSSKRSATTYSESRPTNCECTKDVWASRNDSLVSRTN